jgi:hypothetical protein
MTNRLDAATVRAERQQEKRQASEQASAALTSVMPAIERPPLTLADTPSREAAARAAQAARPAAAEAATRTAGPHGAARPKAAREHTGPQARRSTHPGRRPSHINKHVGTLRATPDGEDHNDDRHTSVMPASADTD